jgi:AraC-like DNA-binding protein
MKPAIHRPPQALKDHVDYFWTMESGEEARGVSFKTFASALSGIVFQHHDGLSAFGATTPLAGEKQPSYKRDLPILYAYGKITGPSRATASGPYKVTGVAFKPLALSALFGIDATELTGAPIELRRCGAADLCDQLLDADAPQRRLELMTGFLIARAVAANADDMLIATSLRLIHEQVRSIRVPYLLKSLNVSERQFERRFLRTVGVSPHRYIRIMRFQQAVRLMNARRFEKLADVAYELNYADQSHLIKDIKEFSGDTPRGLSQTVRSSLDSCGDPRFGLDLPAPFASESLTGTGLFIVRAA